jgi:hypothetical protein
VHAVPFRLNAVGEVLEPAPLKPKLVLALVPSAAL